MQTITRKGNFDAAHRIVGHQGKCANLHGHTYLYELEFEFDPVRVNSTNGGLGYAIDFAEIKSIAGQYIDDMYDHATIFNPKDTYLVPFLKSFAPGMRRIEMYIMGKGKNCNPSVENIAVQLFGELSLLANTDHLKLKSIKLYETPNCWTVATKNSLLPWQVLSYKQNAISKWKSRKQ